ncbi:hypothetical protein MPTK1_5g13410 [Marchantia polymorpha subsp. ruderalis]|uniref:DNA replication checkpoint mediator MRC1 domain-containing protein n=2 Tax=Marchantia polymorpha TaxID=3197 RepID=A0A176VSP6_MARPO|nr:hypothetical protein AXG93_961s1170 [Marchantia polymorpha subsp. ruderalis]PTQ41829.1 hypothetical protein MARPO_0032s0034 [Marchantia polymorpha]BBN11615.1 hypothetical protein Mp_5g13410 [Marchantia polymorpha subsp. ruderalis]|eukprot:PTQ41829.1 hypothetical protein MARPO_0032s0034 [Marchantia polymorpha]
MDGGNSERENTDMEPEMPGSPQNDKKRKSLATEDDPSLPDLEIEYGLDAAASISKKKRREEAESIDAETQRLLRESKKVAFPEEQLEQKPISSVLEKMRNRKLQRAQKKRSSHQVAECSSKRPILDLKKALSVDSGLNLDLEDDIEVVMVKPPTHQVLAVKQEPGGTSGTNEHMNTTAFVESVEGPSRPSTPETRPEASRADKSSVVSGKREAPLRPLLIDSQELYCDSQLSPSRDEAPDARGRDEDVTLPEYSMNLQFDSETQDEDSSSRVEDEEKENKDPKRAAEVLPTVSRVRGLIDDEAEDEDEDLLEDEDDEDDDTTEDLRDLLAQDVTEKAADRKRRADLHRKWLQQQDDSMTDTILQRIETGWRNKAKKQKLPGILDEVDDDDSTGCKSQTVEEATEEPTESTVASLTSSIKRKSEEPTDHGVKRSRSQEVEETEDDDCEEEDEWFRRQRLLNESEEHSELPSVHDDETSRQIFSLINKVNVATIKSTKVTTGSNDMRPLGVAHHHTLSHVQSSFVRRTTTTSVPPTTRQGSGNSRSYIFGRDDSNSNHASRPQGSDDKGVKDLSPATGGDNQNRKARTTPTSRGGSSGGKGNEAKAAETTGPSLFQILRQQAADLEKSVLARDSSFSLNGSSSRSGDLSIFSVMKPSKPSRKSKG